MAEINDSLGGSYQNSSSKSELLNEIRSLLTANVKTADNSRIQIDELKEINKILTDINKDHGEHLNEVKKYIEDVKKILEQNKKSSGNKGDGYYLKRIRETFSSKKSPLFKFDSAIRDAMRELGNNLGKQINNAGGGGGGGGGGGNGSVPPVGGSSASGGSGGNNDPSLKDLRNDYQGIESLKFLHDYSKLIDFTTDLAGKMEKAFLGVENVAKNLVTGVIENERKFTQDVRALAYETAGVTAETKKLQKVYSGIEQTAFLTGVDRTEFQKSYLNNLKKGIKNLNVAKNISIAQLNTETMIGVEAGQLSETFTEWNQSFSLSTAQVADIGRGIRDVARFTGVTGENLTKAVSASQEFLKAMRNAATLTSATAKNLIEISANAQKMGIADSLAPITKALSSTTAFYNDAGPQIQSLLVNGAASVGRLDELQKGVLLRTKSGVKDLAKGLENTLKGFGVSSLEEVENLPDEVKMRLNLSLKSAFGVELGEFKKIIETLRESGKGFSERLSDINKKQKTNLTLEEKILLKEEERKLKVSKTFDVLTALDEASKGASSMNDALAKFGSRRKDFEEDLGALGIAWTSNIDVARQALKQNVAEVNNALEGVGKAKLNISSKDIEKALQDPTLFREMAAQLTKAEQQAGVAQKKGLDPITQMGQTLNETNDILRQMSNALINGLPSWLSKGLVVLAAISSILTSSLGFLVKHNASLKQMYDLWKNGLKNPKKDGSSGGLDKKDKSQDSKKGFMEKYTKNQDAGGVASATGGINAKSIWASARDLGTAAPAILALGAAAVAVGVAISWLGTAASKLGLDLVKIGETVAVTAIIVGGVALIGEHIEPLAEGLKKAGEFFSKYGKKIATYMFQGAIGIAIMVPAIVLLGAVMTALSAKILSGLGLSDPKEVSDIVECIKTLLWGVSEIALAVMLSAGALALIGAVLVASGPWGIATAVALMVTGALGLRLLTTGIVALAAAIVKIGQGILAATGLDIGTTKEIVETVQTVINGAYEISSSVMKAAGLLTVIGASFFGILLTIPLMLLGAKVLTLLTDGIVALTTSILHIAKEGMGGLDAATAAEIVKNFSAVMTASNQISEGAWAMSQKLIEWGKILANPITWLTMPIMYLGSKYLYFVAPAITSFVESIVDFAQKINEKIGGTNLDAMAKTIISISNVVTRITGLITTLQEKLGPLVKGTGLFSLGASQLTKIKEMGDEFAKTYPAIIDFVEKTVVGNSNTINLPRARESAVKLRVVGDVISATAKLVTSVNESFVPLTKSSWYKASELQKMEDKFEDISNFISTFAGFLNQSFVGTINTKITDINKIKEASSKLAILAPMLHSIKVSMEAGKVLSEMATGGMAKSFAKNKDTLATWVGNLADFVSKDVVDVITNKFPDIQKIETAMAILRKTNNMMSSLNDLAFNTEKVRGRAAKSGGIIGFNNVKVSPLNLATGPLDETADKVQQNIATSTTGTQTVTAPEFKKIADAEDEQTTLLKEILKTLRKLENNNGLVSNMGGDSDDGEPNIVPSSPPNFFKHKTGKHMQGPQKGITNMGYQSS